MFRPSRPETIARRAIERELDRQARAIVRETRLSALAKEHGPDSIWAELLAIEHAVAEERAQ